MALHSGGGVPPASSVGATQLTDGGVSTADLANGILSADATGRAKMADNFFNEATVDAKFADASIPADKISGTLGTEVARNCILGSRVVSGNADFFSVSGLTLTLEADATDPFTYDISGTEYELTSDITLAVTDDADNFIWINNLGAMGRSAVPPKYDFAEPGSPSANDYWFDLGKNVMKQYDGAAWQTVSRIFIGYVRADSTAINARYFCNAIGISPYQRFSMFGDGSDGFLNVTSGTTTIDNTKNYTFVVIRSSGVVTHTADTNGLLTIKSQGGIACVGTSGINLTGKGCDNGAGATGTGGTAAGSGFGGGGGGGGGGTNAGGTGGIPWRLTKGNSNSSAAGSTAGTSSGGAGASGKASTIAASDGWLYSVFLYGGGGGGGGGDNSSAGAHGGEGGGSCNIITDSVAIGASATINANGVAGVTGGGANRGGGGGGGGGVINMACRNLFGGANFTCTGGAAGGSGGAGSGAGGAGADGAAARVKI